MTESIEEKPKKKKDSSKSSKTKIQIGEEKEIYFIIFYQRKQKENPKELVFSEDSDITPQNILIKEIKTKNDKYVYKKVFKFKNIDGKKNVKLSFFFGEEEYKYIITFEIKDKVFVYDVILEKGHKYLENIPKEKIEQKSVNYEDKLELFLEALKQNKEESKLPLLYEETIELYSKKSSFSFLISLFAKIHENNKFCNLLLQKFYDININIKGKDKKDNNNNSDRNEKLGDKFNSLMVKIESQSESLINSNEYNPIHFYGILICYLNFYDYNTFEKCINKLYKEKPETLYEILLVYYSHFFNPIKKDENDKDFFINFFEYIISEKEFSYFNIGLKFISDIDTFITVIDKTKEKIYNKYIKGNSNQISFKSIDLKDTLKLKKEKKTVITNGITSINKYSEEIKNLLVYFKSDFWKSILKEFNKPDPDCFEVCLKLREIFIEYSKIIKSICDKEKDKDIIKDITDFLKIDEFAYLLNDNIRKYFTEKKGKLKNSEILGYIQKYNPYYKEEEYKFRREAYILDDLTFEYDIDSIDEDVLKEHSIFIETFKSLEYEDIFKNNMVKFIDTMINKIKDISSFDTIIDLIRVDKIEEKAKEYLEKLKNKYELIVKPEIEKLSDDKLKRPVEIIAKFEKLIFEQENNKDFLENNINKLKICPLIYNQLMIICKDDKYNVMKEFIYKQFLNNIKNIDSIIALIDSLEKKDKENFLEELMKKCKFTREEFYSTEENNKINLLCTLYEKKKIEKISGDIETTLQDIINDIDKEEIDKKTLEEFFTNSEEVVKRRLGLIKLKFDNFGPENAHYKLKKILENIKNDIKILSHNKKSLSIFQRERYQDEIKKMIDFIKKLENIKIKEYNDDKFTEPIESLKGLEVKANQVDLVQDFLLFEVIYENSRGNNQEIRFNKANDKLEEIKKLFETKEKPDIDEIYKQNKEIFDNIKKKLINNEKRAEEFFETFKKYFNIGENKVKDLALLFNSKKYELDLKSIIYFFNSLNKEDDWNKKLSNKYEKLSEMNLEDLKKNLEELKKEEIYDYQIKNNYSKIFTSLYEKKEAIDFLLKKINSNIEELYDRIDPNSPTITIQKIDDTKICIEVFKQFESKKNNKEIFKYIKTLREEIKAFESYSKIFSSIIELDRNDNFILNIFDQIDDIIKNAKFLFLHETEIFSYGEDNKITMEELIHLKNKINVSANDENIKEEDKIKHDKSDKSKAEEVKKKIDEEKNKEKNDILKIKLKKLLFYKNLVTNMEVIYENMQILKTKGNNLPIDIKIIVQYDRKNEADYYLDQKKSSFGQIETFLLNARNDYIKKLDLAYKEKKHLRYLYGKLFRKIIEYLDGGSFEKVIDIFKYILNKNNDDKIKTSKPSNPQIIDFVKNYTDYNSKSFENIFNYFITLFEANNTSLQKLYDSMLMIEHNKYKGVYLHECEENSIGKFIYELFLQKIGQNPIAQNILISSKETSTEEIQAFLYRALLCDYNTLFVVEINESLSDYQQGIMYNFLDELLIYKMEKYKAMMKGINVEKGKTNEYLDACIVFIYEKKNKDNLSFINEIGKLDKQDIQIEYNLNDTNEEPNQIDISNIKVITSDRCGLGKSFKIKKMIEEKNQKYFHFPLGGILTKKVISEKILNLLEKIKNENEKEKDNTTKGNNTTDSNEKKEIKNAIHLDLTESEETSIINEFLFSLLITKFYTNSETIIYIPKDIEIYIEIPNCFKDYLSQFGILNLLPKENITLDNIPKLHLSQEMIDIFNKMVELNTNELIEEKFLKKYMDNTKKYSYHQIIIFIKLFISQYNKFKSKLKFIEKEEDVTEKVIKDFAESTKSFINGGFQNLIMEEINENELKKENKDYIDLLSDIYENDLKDKKFDIPLIFIIKEKMVYNELKLMKIISDENNTSKDYLFYLKKNLNIPNEVETEKGELKSLLSILNYKTDNYVITSDNFTKMVLLVYRIIADIPVILMGETGCGKTALITKLSQILNNGEIVVEIININPGITDKFLCKKMKELNEKAKEQEKELWVFFDEINTCLSLSLLTEIFVNKTFNGEKLNNNIRLIGACNPYRRRKKGIERCGYGRENENNEELVYLVQPLPQSLLNYVFSFGALNEEDEKKYIYNIIEKLFKEGEEKLHDATKDVIFKCHKYLRETFDTSIVSLREISRFFKMVDFFKKYFSIKMKCEENEESNNTRDLDKSNNKNNMEIFYKIISIICSVYLCYYIRLIDETKRVEFNNQLRESLITLANSVKICDNNKSFAKADKDMENDEDEDENKGKENLASKVENKSLKLFMQEYGIKHFSDFLRLEENYLLDKIELKNGIGKNDLLKENVFLMFVAVTTKIPLIIVGKPGTGKSLSSQLIYNSMRGEYSKDPFFREFPQIILSYFQGSKSTKPEDIEKLFEIAENKLKFYIDKEEYKNKLPISMILFDELGLAEKSESNPLKVLHSKLEYAGNEKGVSFIGISNYSLDAAKVNRAMNLSVPNLESKIDQLISTANSIVESVSDELNENKIFEILSRAYYEYKTKLTFIKELIVLKQYNEKVEKIDLKKSLFQEIKIKKEYKNLLRKETKIKEDFHSNRDLYNYIRGIAIRVAKLGSFDEAEIKAIINNYIERNFGGIDYEIDISLDLKLADIEKDIDSIKEILKEKISEKKQDKKPQRGKKEKTGKNDKKDKIKVSSVFLFKKIYNMVCDNLNEKTYKLDNKQVIEYDLNRCIINNIADSDSRYLLLEIKSSMVSLIHRNIRIQNPDKEIVCIDGSPFVDDDNNEYKFIKLREIQLNANTDKLVIMQNLNQIQPFLYDLYNMNYIIKDEEKCVRICFDSFSESLTPVKDSFRIIILVDRKFINEIDFALLNRLEKMKISFEKLLDDNQKALAKKIIEDIDFKKHIEAQKINYELKDLLINCGKEEIQGLIYYEMKKNNNKLDENKIKENIHNKIIKISSQDIISILPEGHKIKELYLNEKKYYNLKSYILDLKNGSWKITIIYTFDSMAVAINGVRKEMKFLISNIRKEDQLERIIKEIKYQNGKLHTNSNDETNNNSNDETNNIIYIAFEQFNSNKIQFISEYIKKHYKNDNYRYIFIIHIQRNFNSQVNNMIYSIPDIDPDIEQLFIDNLNGPNIRFKDLLKKNIKEILNDNSVYMNLNNEFNRLLINFVYKELNKKRNKENISSFNIKDMTKSVINDIPLKKKDNIYSQEIIKYIDNNNYFKEKIIDKAKNFLSEDSNAEGNSEKIIDRILRINYIGKNSLDIISCTLNYIKEEIFGKYVKYIFAALEDNNILTTLIEIQNNKNNEIDDSIIKQLIENSLEMLTYDDKRDYNPKFLYNYKIPGFYNSYKNLSDYINNNIIVDYFNSEKKLRKYDSKANAEKKKNEFNKKEKELLSSLYDYLNYEDKFLFENIETERISTNLLLKDYISFYLDKYDLKNETNNNLIELLLNLRFNLKNNNIIEQIKIVLMKMIWMETNANYILKILTIYSHIEKLFNDGNKLFEMIKNKIYDEDRSIKYIINETRNPEYTKEVNECYYILLASFCFCLTEEIQLSENLDFENNNNIVGIDQYLDVLKKINLSMQDLNDSLNISLNEMYIIDELIAIIELQKFKMINIQKIIDMRKLLRENALIIQRDQPDKYSELIVNFENIYQKLIEEKVKEIKTEEDKIYENKFYDTLKYIYLKEITKIIDSNYRNKIFEKIIRDKETIKRSGDILQILLKKTIKTTTGEKDFKSNLNTLKKGDEIVRLIENNLLDNQENNYISLQETILSFFEKSSLIYLNNILEESKNIDEGSGNPLEIFEDCVKFLVKYNFTDKLSAEIKHIRKLFCIGFIKVYCYKFIKMIDENNPKLNDPLSIVNILEKLSDKEKKMNEIIKLYIYKTIYNQNGKQLEVFINKNKKKLYKFDKYKGFKDFFKFEEEEKINYGFETLDNDYEAFFNKIEKYKKKGFDKKINKSEIINEESESFIDNFINTSNILILTKLKNEDFELSDEYENYYNNICKPLFEGEEKISVLIEFLFNPKKYEELKNYGINSSNIEALLFGFRYCLNCFSEIQENDDEDKIYSSLYDKKKISYLTEKCYPGSNPKDEPKYELYNKITNHFKEKPNEGCYVCLCEKGYYHSVPSGFPGDNEKDMNCPNCGKPIGTEYIEEESEKVCQIINRNDYVRIFKDDEEIEKTKEDSWKKKKLQEINYMTIDKFKEDYINKLYKEDKGLHRINENYFKKNDKMVRNLSQISYRLLNYILYSHLFFAKLYTGISENFDKYLPEKINKEDNSPNKMSWGQTLNECWILLKNELNKKDINFVEIFMNFTFKDLYDKLNSQECIDDYENLINFEDKLEELIQKKIELSKEECKKYKNLINKNGKDKNSFVSLLTEKFDSSNYDKEKYPNYDNFYYTDYLDEENVSKLLEHMNKDQYLILNRYLEYTENKKRNGNKKKKDENYYSLDNLNIFISVLNLYHEKYSHAISREFAESKILEDEEIYRQNTNKIDKFIKFFNKLQESENKKVKKDKKDKKEKKEKKVNTKNNEDKEDKMDKKDKKDKNKEDKKKKEEKDENKNNDDKDYLYLSAKDNHLSDILLDPENKYGKAYKEILQKFIERQNNELSDLLDKKIIDGKIDVNSTNKINIQQIKEDEIFTFNIPDKFSFINETFNSSYRKIIDNNNYEIYNQYEINFDSIEERLTNLLLKNKKLLKDDIIEFSYNNELFTNEVSNVITTFKDNYNIENLTLDDKEIIYKFYDTNKSNTNLYKKIIDDFMTLIKYLVNRKEDNEMISEINSQIENNISPEFLNFFEDKKELTINKTIKIFEYFLKFIFKDIKDDLDDYKLDFDDKREEKKKKDELEKYFTKEEEDNDDENNIIVNQKIINKNNLASAIRWFIILVLFGEKDKDNKIKANKKNLINYLNVEDLWEKDIYKDNRFNRDLNELKKFNFPMNKIIWLYDYLVEEEEEEEDYIKEIEDYIEKKNVKPESSKLKKPDSEVNSSSDDDNKSEDSNKSISNSVNSGSNDEDSDGSNDGDEEGD